MLIFFNGPFSIAMLNYQIIHVSINLFCKPNFVSHIDMVSHNQVTKLIRHAEIESIIAVLMTVEKTIQTRTCECAFDANFTHLLCIPLPRWWHRRLSWRLAPVMRAMAMSWIPVEHSDGFGSSLRRSMLADWIRRAFFPRSQVES